MRVVLHCNEMDKWDMVVSNVHHLINEPEIVSVSVVLNGEGVLLALEKEAIESIDIFVCENSLQLRHIDREQIKDGFRITPSGVVKLTMLQYNNYAYIKP